MQRSYDNPSDTPDFHREIWDATCSKYKFVAIAAPRGHAKSTAVTHAYTIANVVFRTADFILIVADTETQATFFLADIKKELSENIDLMQTFGIRGIEASYGGKDSNTDVIVIFDDGHAARLIAKGAGQSLRGVKWKSKRPNLIVGDDLENDEMVMNKDRRNNFRRWISGTLIPCLSKDGLLRVVGTILHTDSQLNRWMPRRGDKSKPPTITDLCEKSHPHATWHALRYRAHDRAFTVALWPEYKPLEWLKEQRQAYIDQGLNDVWAQEMLNVPYDESSAPFLRKYFTGMEDFEHAQRFNYYISTDFATSEKQKTDYTVFIVAGVNEKGTVYILHVIQQRMSSPEILETLNELAKQYKPEMVFAEKGQILNTLKPLLVNKMLEEDGEFYIINELPSITDKRTRSATIRARMAVGAVRFDKSKDWYPGLEEEMLGFPRVEHDDQVDGMSLLGLALNKFVEAPTDQEQAEDDYDEEMQHSGILEQGRNLHTGY